MQHVKKLSIETNRSKMSCHGAFKDGRVAKNKQVYAVCLLSSQLLTTDAK